MNKRKARATARAAALAEVLRWHLEYMRYKGDLEDPPVVRDGVAFYQVGRNASHYFFAGVDSDGRKFICTVGDSCDENGELTVVEHVYEVDTFSGHYLGHY